MEIPVVRPYLAGSEPRYEKPPLARCRLKPSAWSRAEPSPWSRTADFSTPCPMG